MTGASFKATNNPLDIIIGLQILLKSVYNLPKTQTTGMDLSFQRQYHFTLLIDTYLRDNGFQADQVKSTYYFIQSVQSIKRFQDINLFALHSDYLNRLANCKLMLDMKGETGRVVHAARMPKCPVDPMAQGGALVVVHAFVTQKEKKTWAQNALVIARVFQEEDRWGQREHKEQKEHKEEKTSPRTSTKRKADAPAPTPPQWNNNRGPAPGTRLPPRQPQWPQMPMMPMMPGAQAFCDGVMASIFNPQPLVPFNGFTPEQEAVFDRLKNTR